MGVIRMTPAELGDSPGPSLGNSWEHDEAELDWVEGETSEGGPPPAASLASVPIRGGRSARGVPKADLYEDVLRQPAAPPPASLPWARPAQSPEELVQYWQRLRDGVALPSPLDLDRPMVVQRWPNSGLLAFDAKPDEDASETMPRAVALSEGAVEAADPSYIPIGPDIADWVLELAEQALRLASAQREVRRFPTLVGGRLEVVVLPLALRAVPDHVLYHLRRA